MLAQRRKWNRREFQAAVFGSLFFPRDLIQLRAKHPEVAEAELLVKANNAFALTLLRELDDSDQGKNHFLSPFSVQSALSMTIEGARGETADEMGKTLQYPETLKKSGEVPWDMTQLRNGFRLASERLRSDQSDKTGPLRSELAKLLKELEKTNDESRSLASANKPKEANAKSTEASKLADRINKIAKQVDKYELSTANSLWIDKSFAISPKYQATISENYTPASVNAADFRNNTEPERKRINQWVQDQTQGKIRDLLPSGAINSLTRLVIANAVYFKGSWQTPFKEELTKPAKFTLHDHKKIDVPFMNINRLKEGKYAAFNEDGSIFETPEMIEGNFDEQLGYPSKNGFQVAELPYNGDNISMMIFLPSSANGLDTLLRTLTAVQIDACASKLERREFQLSLPKFKLETAYDLVKPLMNLGMKQAFSAAQADFSGLTDVRDANHELHIATVFHKAFLDVNEKGTEAAAATSVTLDLRSTAIAKRPFIPLFKADRPFLFVIRENTSGLILFIGKVDNPSA